jgi:hypothetical protein
MAAEKIGELQQKCNEVDVAHQVLHLSVATFVHLDDLVHTLLDLY